MRKFVRNNIIELMHSVSDGISYAFTADEASANATLGDCIDAVSAAAGILGEELTAAGAARYAQSISEVTGSLELLLTDIDDMQTINDLAEKTFESLQRIIGFLELEPEIKTEIVFFPYKAAMWDSLESIWQAASADERCHVSVVPIPYYDRDTTKHLAKLHYEGHAFPGYVSITPFDEYDIALLKPDIAYIHNPYDEYNAVTSVQPEYYSRELKKHVKKLVYVPYYVGDVPSSRPFAAVTAELAADIVIAASKDDAKAYRKGGVKFEIATLGSPKTDRAVNLEKNRPELPEEWSRLRGKKVFLLNTSIASLLNYGSDYFESIQKLITIIEAKEGAALVWRPHPLTVSTIDAMRPDLRSAYNELMRGMENKTSAIADLSPEMATAMAISDAYIGDGWSSLVYLYALTGKPVYLLNFETPQLLEDHELTEMLTAGVLYPPAFDGNDAWSFCFNMNALCKLDLRTGEAKYLSSVPGEANRGWLYAKPVKAGDTLLLPPIGAKEWAEYDILTDNWKKHPIPKEAKPIVNNGASFYAVMDTDGFAIIAPNQSKAFVRYNKQTKSLQYHTEWYKSFSKYIKDKKLGLFSDISEPVGNSVYLPSAQANIVLELDVNTIETTVHEVGDKANRYWGIAYDGNCFWLTKYRNPETDPPQNAVVRWNKNTGEYKEFPLEPASYEPGKEFPEFYSISFFDGKILVLPLGVNEVYQIDIETEEVSIIDTGLPYKLKERKNEHYSFWQNAATISLLHEQDRLIALSFYDYSLLHFEAGKSGVRKQKIVLEGIKHLLRDPMRTSKYINNQNKFLTTSDFISEVISGEFPAYDAEQAEHYRSINANSDGTCGEKVHRYIMGRVL